MKLNLPRVMCTAKPEPHAWARDGRSGIIYRVELGDGSSSIRVNCDSEACYASFAPWQLFSVDIDITQNQNGILNIRALSAVPAK